MKKLLLSIVGILGIFSFCSADGIYHNSDLGLISVVDNGNVYTFEDKNVGSNSSCYGNSCSLDSNVGSYFQWGNNYAFNYGFNPNITTTAINTSSYGPSEYSSGTWVHRSSDWSSSKNNNLWGDVSNTLLARRGPCPEGFHVPLSSDFVNIYNYGYSRSLWGSNFSLSTFLEYYLFPTMGYYNSNHNFDSNSYGYYWASSVDGTTANVLALELLYNNNSIDPVDSEGRSYGFLVRCFKNTPEIPTSFRTVIHGDSISSPVEPANITVLYNNGNSSTSITCNGDNVIQIDGLSTMTATNKFTPYFNIDYIDEDNQSLVESYSKDILYLRNGLFKKTYTGDNERILTNQSECSIDSSFSGYTPTFDVVFTGDTFNDTGNVFNNFAQNSLQVALSNIPSYIQYVIIIMLLFFILGLARRKKRR